MFSDSNNWVNAVPVIVERQSPNEIDLFVSEEVPPLVIIVHIIQVIAPGFLMLNFCYDYLCLGEVVWHTFFPDQGWLEENKDMLIHILGGRDKYDLILNHSEAYRIDVDFTYYYKGDSHTLINSELIKRNPLFPSELLVGSSQKF
ncbi:hypothetical protein M413DRAFT_240116 [Hebeloma cylindrosporum]|uniref:Uncharacterized protein n=1 Tax=Hebeloma cylindrosporum TaxID=76867 RepID=A0A0C2YCE1_HEBCY|nr:hypothetical protein M413DRAFT_240116 [Hebeloma cylindrosporum h7]